MTVLDTALELYRNLKAQQLERDSVLAAIKEDAKRKTEETIEGYGENLDQEIEALRKRILAEHPATPGETVDVDYPGFGRVQVKWMPKVEIVDAEALAQYLESVQKMYLFERKVEVKKALLNRIVEGLAMADLPLPPGVVRRTEATLYITLEDRCLF